MHYLEGLLATLAALSVSTAAAILSADSSWVFVVLAATLLSRRNTLVAAGVLLYPLLLAESPPRDAHLLWWPAAALLAALPISETAREKQQPPWPATLWLLWEENTRTPLDTPLLSNETTLHEPT